MSKFTRGPWAVDPFYWIGDTPDSCRGEWDTQNKSVMAGNHSICMVQGDNEKPMEANARLIAAAPDMYEALVKTLEWFKKLDDWSGVGDPDLKAITDAIDKANGESTDAPGA